MGAYFWNGKMASVPSARILVTALSLFLVLYQELSSLFLSCIWLVASVSSVKVFSIGV